MLTSRSSQGKEQTRNYLLRLLQNPWKGDDETIKRIAKGGIGRVNHEGYVNVAIELGLGSERDMSSYHPYWVARQYR